MRRDLFGGGRANLAKLRRFCPNLSIREMQTSENQRVVQNPYYISSTGLLATQRLLVLAKEELGLSVLNADFWGLSLRK